MDITMCTSKYCPQKNTCLRTQAEHGVLQSYTNFEYTCNEESGFQDYIKSTLNKINTKEKKDED